MVILDNVCDMLQSIDEWMETDLRFFIVIHIDKVSYDHHAVV